MRWLVRLATPPRGLVLDPFGGSGTTGIAARLQDMGYLLVERDPDFCRLARERLGIG